MAAGAAPVSSRLRYTVPVTTRETLHDLVDSLPETSFDYACRVLAELRDDPRAWLQRYAEIDDEPLTDQEYTSEELALIDARFARVRTGDPVPDEEVGRMLGELCEELSRGRTRLSATS